MHISKNFLAITIPIPMADTIAGIIQAATVCPSAIRVLAICGVRHDPYQLQTLPVFHLDSVQPQFL